MFNLTINNESLYLLETNKLGTIESSAYYNNGNLTNNNLLKLSVTTTPSSPYVTGIEFGWIQSVQTGPSTWEPTFSTLGKLVSAPANSLGGSALPYVYVLPKKSGEIETNSYVSGRYPETFSGLFSYSYNQYMVQVGADDYFRYVQLTTTSNNKWTSLGIDYTKIKKIECTVNGTVYTFYPNKRINGTQYFTNIFLTSSNFTWSAVEQADPMTIYY